MGLPGAPRLCWDILHHQLVASPSVPSYAASAHLRALQSHCSGRSASCYCQLCRALRFDFGFIPTHLSKIACGHCAGVDVVTLGQYMRPTKRHMPVVEFVTPEAFAGYETSAKNMGFLYAAAGPMVRSSYRAGEFYLSNVLRKDSQPEAASV